MPYSIMIDAGHGGNDPGAVYKGRREKDDNFALAMELEEFCLKTELMFYIQELQMITFLLLSGQGWQMRQKWIFYLFSQEQQP